MPRTGKSNALSSQDGVSLAGGESEASASLAFMSTAAPTSPAVTDQTEKLIRDFTGRVDKLEENMIEKNMKSASLQLTVEVLENRIYVIDRIWEN